ncbi:MAG: hypothetical protein EON84_12935 [Bradyrhizobiaceae bacterium]|nr:MAG: hypothetical protein EON84_12935 [Bradyrhizobiaceae bacterium]
MSSDEIEVSGLVGRETVAAGSKSERAAVTLRTDDGRVYVLRNGNAPAFGDTSLDVLVGTSIIAQGVAIDQTLILNGWRSRN